MENLINQLQDPYPTKMAKNGLTPKDSSISQTAEEVYQKAFSEPRDTKHESYLKEKGLTKEDIPGLKFGYYHKFPSLIIPMKDLSGKVKSIQHIYYDEQGKKQVRFLKGAEKNGAFLAFGELEEKKKIFVTEGVATAASLNKIVATSDEHKDFLVVSAFTAIDIPVVAGIFRDRFVYAEVIAAPDADDAGNKAAKACKKIGVYPIFPPPSEHRKKTDWNDVYQNLGLKKSFEEFEKSIAIKEAASLTNSEASNKSIPEIEKILEHLDEDPCKDLSMEHFPPKLKHYIESICEMTQAHPIMIIMSVLCSISARIGKKVYIPKSEYFQNLYPNIWSLCINKSGSFKSTALNKGSELALEEDGKILQTMDQIKKRKDDESEELKQDIKKESLKRPILPTRTTTEFLIQHLSEGHQGMILSSEIGEWLGNMQKQHNIDLKQIFTNFYDVDIAPYEHRTKNCGNYIIRQPFITINGVSTIDWIKGQVKADDVFSGFFARMLLFAPPFEHAIPPSLPQKTEQSATGKAAKDEINNTLDNLRETKFSLSTVKSLFDTIHNAMYEMVRNSKYDERCQKFLEPYLKRWSPYTLKLAMIFRVIEDSSSNELNETSLKAAKEIVQVAIKSTAKLFEKELGESQNQKKQRIIFEWIAERAKRGKKTKFRDLLKSKKLDGGSKEYEEVLETLINANKIKHLNPETKNKKEWEYEIIG